MPIYSNSTKCSIAWSLIMLLVFQIIFPYQVLALTGGPSQPEVESFTPAGVSELVDPATGMFSYNIPLMDVGGYPVNLSYQSEIGMEQEASVVGLGWNLNPGVINRNLRGLPDDFDGDEVKKEFNMKPNTTWGVTGGFQTELFGYKSPGVKKETPFAIGVSIGLNHNNYNGFGIEYGITPSLSLGDKNKMRSGGIGLGLTASSSEGIGFSPSISFSKKIGKVDEYDQNLGLNIGTAINSRQGLKAVTFGPSMSISHAAVKRYRTDKKPYEGKSWSHEQISSNAQFSFSTPTFIPSIQFPMRNSSFTFSGRLGLEVFGAQGGVQISGYFSQQKLTTNSLKSKAYGFLYAHHAKNKLNALLDFNREKDNSFSRDTRHLPLSAMTGDVFSVSGQGLSGNYQLHRSDVPTTFDNSSINLNAGESLGLEVGAGNIVRAGGDVIFNNATSYAMKWHDTGSNGVLKGLDFSGGPTNTKPSYEPAYFKMAGERTVDDSGYFNTLGGFEPVRPQLADAGGLEVRTNNTLVRYSEGDVIQTLPDSPVNRSTREKRKQVISYLTATEATQYGLEECILSFPENDFKLTNPTAGSRTTSLRKGHHISEITVLREDGQRYVFGIPAYNNVQNEVSFSVDGSGDNCQSGMVGYSAVDASTGNTKGKENYYNKVSTPAYAHSFLLTAVVSNDYVDRTGNGCTPDDYGNYTQFNYTQVASSLPWRTPYKPGEANYNQGMRSDPLDDKASFIEGEKEVWLLHSIVSRTHVACFYYDTESRTDNRSIEGNSTRARKLDKIVLYGLSDWLGNSNAAEPIKTVRFEYTQNLCPDILNSFAPGSGKLTLKKVWFEYGRSKKGQETPYIFSYSPFNPSYDYKDIDRWGAYKPNPQGLSCTNHASPLSNDEFPYASQDKSSADERASAWRLTQIKLPSGGSIKVEYEAGDYAYVQNRRAMRMFKIYDIRDKAEQAIPAPGNTANLFEDTNPNQYVYFELDNPMSINAPIKVLQEYLGDLILTREPLYYKCLVNIAKPGVQQRWEYVPGYAKISTADYGLSRKAGSANYDLAYFKLEAVGVGDREKGKEANPIAKAAWQFARLNLPEAVYGTPTIDQGDAEQILKAILSLEEQFKQFLKGFNNVMRDEAFGRRIYLPKSWIRLNDPSYKKIGGGSRVKRIEIDDAWQKMAGSPHEAQNYGQEYFYTTVENGDTISSGVAAYEPIIGGDENPWRQPVFSDETVLCAPDNEHYIEEPLGEMFFPAPTIIYSKVTVRNLPKPNVIRNATGWTVHEFYTARDFPVLTRNTFLAKKPKKSTPLLGLLKIKAIEYMTAVEGFVVELNDMHGKPKATWVYDEFGTRLSGIEYRYKQQTNGKLDNRCTVIYPNGAVGNSVQIGVDISVTADSRESGSTLESGGINLNIDNFLIPPFIPGIVPTAYPSSHYEETRFRSFTLTKVINRYGLLDEVIAYDLGARVSTRNVAYDAETGDVLLTQTTNSFSDPVYQLTYPAHWAYPGMAGAYRNIGAVFTGLNCSTGNCTISGIGENLFFWGDEVSVQVGGSYQARLWVKDVSNSSIYLIDAAGTPANFNNATLKIIRSGHRNQANTAVSSLTCLNNPIKNGTLQFDDLHVLDASAQEMSDRWQTFCKERCYCVNRQQNIDCFLALANEISADGLLFAPPTNPVDLTPYYSLMGCSQIPLSPKIGCPSTAYRYSSEINIYGLNMTVMDTSNCNSCNVVTIKLPAGWSPNTVKNIKFSNLIPYSDFYCSERLHFSVTMTAESILPKPVGTPILLIEETYGTQGGYDGYCLDFLDCINNSDTNYCGLTPNKQVNPYFEGILGSWRPKRTYAFLTDRVQQDALVPAIPPYHTRTRMRFDGWYKDFSSFWTKPTGSTGLWTKNLKYWTWAQETTRINPLGIAIEARDALNRYSAEVLGYLNSFVQVTAGNAGYEEIMYEGFEDARYGEPFSNIEFQSTCAGTSYSTDACWPDPHFWLDYQAASTIAHTGKSSLPLNPDGGPHSKTIRLKTCQLNKQEAFVPFILQECDCVGKFAPSPGKKYVFSAWVREDRPPTTLAFADPKVIIWISGKSFTFQASGEIIEGWQRIYGEFDIPPDVDGLAMNLYPGTALTFYDDLRIHPFDASFKAYVYDSKSLRFTYELDDNNYFTKYEYNGSGMLERVKKETERGVMTIQETRFSNAKQ